MLFANERIDRIVSRVRYQFRNSIGKQVHVAMQQPKKEVAHALEELFDRIERIETN